MTETSFEDVSKRGFDERVGGLRDGASDLSRLALKRSCTSKLSKAGCQTPVKALPSQGVKRSGPVHTPPWLFFQPSSDNPVH